MDGNGYLDDNEVCSGRGEGQEGKGGRALAWRFLSHLIQIQHNNTTTNNNQQSTHHQLITLAALGMGRDPTYEYLMEVKACMLNDTTTATFSPPAAAPAEEKQQQQGEAAATTTEGRGQPITVEGEPRITFARLAGCPRIVEDLDRHARRPKTWTAGAVEDVSAWVARRRQGSVCVYVCEDVSSGWRAAAGVYVYMCMCVYVYARAPSHFPH